MWERFVIISFVCLLVIRILISEDFENLSTIILESVCPVQNQDEQLKCTRGSFSLYGMSSCHPWLGCPEIQRGVNITDSLLGAGVEKMVKEGFWQGHAVAVSFLRSRDFLEDFQHNLEMLQHFSKEPGVVSNKVVQLIGWCLDETPLIITEKHSLGAANQINSILEKHFRETDSLKVRFKFCIEFVQILTILHFHSDGPYVMCDTNDPEKALSQFLVTDNLTLVLNDMDAVPRVNKKIGHLIICGHRELHGDFVAPEQLWPYDDLEYNESLMAPYDEKVDIWKIPDICNHLIDNVRGSSKLQLHLFNIHSRCKQKDPQKRPTADEVLQEYKNVFKSLENFS